MPAVSILLPVRDGEATLAAGLESLLGQTFRDFELVVVDDHSSDGTRRIIDRFARRDPRVRCVVAPEPGGLVGALRAGHAAATAPLLARHDADDLAHPERLAAQLELLARHPEIAVCGCGVRIVGNATDPDGSPGAGFRRYQAWINALTEPAAIARDRFIESPLVHPTVVMRRGPFEAVGGYRDPPWAEDYDLWLRLLEAGHAFAKVPRILLDWRDGPARLTRSDPRYRQERFLAARAHYLARLTAVRERGVMISGAGPTGKSLARRLAAEGVTVHALLDVHPGRIGRRIAGVPVRAADELPSAGPAAPVQLAAVGRVGRREPVVELLAGRGYRPGVDAFCVA